MKKVLAILFVFVLLSSCAPPVTPNNNAASEGQPTENPTTQPSQSPVTQDPRDAYEKWDPNSSGNSALCFDESKRESKKILTSKDLGGTFLAGADSVSLTYLRTANNKDLPVNKRADSYGTVDVYVDDVGVEYSFLYNTDVLCGVIWYDAPYTYLPQEEAIPEKTAVEAANKFISAIRDDSNEYKLIYCTYTQNGEYSLSYYKPVDGHKSDDEIWIWMQPDGEITYFSEHNYKRYDNVSVTDDEMKLAKEDGEKAIKEHIEKLESGTEYEIEDSYISKNDEGEIVLAQKVIISILVPGLDDDGMAVHGEIFYQPIKKV